MPQKGFFGSLFDFSFTSFVTTKIVKFLYVLTVVLLGLGALVFVIASFSSSAAAGLFMLFIGAPLAFLLYVIYTRVLLELFIAIFRIMETNTELVALQRQALVGVPGPPTAATSPMASAPPSAPPPAPPAIP
jgi:hypothetical protein